MNTTMTEFRRFFKNLCILVLWTKVASALEGLTQLCLVMNSEKGTRNSDTFENKFLKSWIHKFSSDQHFSIKYFIMMLLSEFAMNLT